MIPVRSNMVFIAFGLLVLGIEASAQNSVFRQP